MNLFFLSRIYIHWKRIHTYRVEEWTCTKRMCVTCRFRSKFICFNITNTSLLIFFPFILYNLLLESNHCVYSLFLSMPWNSIPYEMIWSLSDWKATEMKWNEKSSAHNTHTIWSCRFVYFKHTSQSALRLKLDDGIWWPQQMIIVNISGFYLCSVHKMGNHKFQIQRIHRSSCVFLSFHSRGNRQHSNWIKLQHSLWFATRSVHKNETEKTCWFTPAKTHQHY